MKLLIPFLAAAGLLAQNSHPVIENDQVRVLKVVDQPHHKGSLHKHDLNRVMIYLQAGTEDLTYQDAPQVHLTWSAGEAKWSPAGGLHTSELTSAQPVTIVEIELKKPAGAAVSTPNALDPVKVDPQHYSVAWENEQVRVLHVKMGAHQSAPMHVHQLNRVVVYLTDQKIRVKTPEGKEETVEHKQGDVSWGPPAQHREENVNDNAFELYAVELKN
jgi:uncharacterized RmlC-like cupin family protein